MERKYYLVSVSTIAYPGRDCLWENRIFTPHARARLGLYVGEMARQESK